MCCVGGIAILGQVVLMVSGCRGRGGGCEFGDREEGADMSGRSAVMALVLEADIAVLFEIQRVANRRFCLELCTV